MNLKELIEEVALENDVNPGRVRKIAKALIDKIEQTLSVDQVIRTQTIVLRPISRESDPNIIGIVKRITPKIEE